VMILLPFLGAVGQILFGGAKRSAGLCQWVALATSFLSGLIGILQVGSIGAMPGESGRSESLPWIGSYAISYEVGIDGFNIVPVLLISLVFPILVVSEWRREKGGNGVRGLLLLLQTYLLAIVCARDLFLLFFFWVRSPLPCYFLLAMRGGRDREKAAFRSMITSSVGNVLIFTALVLVYYSVTPHTFSLQE